MVWEKRRLSRVMGTEKKRGSLDSLPFLTHRASAVRRRTRFTHRGNINNWSSRAGRQYVNQSEQSVGRKCCWWDNRWYVSVHFKLRYIEGEFDADATLLHTYTNSGDEITRVLEKCCNRRQRVLRELPIHTPVYSGGILVCRCLPESGMREINMTRKWRWDV